MSHRTVLVFLRSFRCNKTVILSLGQHQPYQYAAVMHQMQQLFLLPGELVVYKPKKSQYWWYKFNWHGQVIRESTKQTNKRTAEQIQAARRTDLAKADAGLGPPKSVPTLREFATQFKDTIETECDRPDTVSFYSAKLRYLLADPILAGCRLDQIDESVIDDYKQRRLKTVSRRGTPLSPGSVNKELATLRRLLGMAHRRKILMRIPDIDELPGEGEREFVLSFEQEDAYLRATSGDLRDIAVLMIDTGLRMGEALKLAVADVRLVPAEGAKYSLLTVRKRNAKNSKSRNIPLTPRVFHMLERRVLGVAGAKAGLVFQHDDGRPLRGSRIDQQHSAVRKRLKLSAEFVPHSFRHTYGTRLGESGADAFTIMKLMGHSSVTVSQRYVHPSPETVERAVDRMEAASERKRAAFIVA